MPQAAPAQQIPVGSLYGLPGFTETFEQYENINNFSTTLAATAQTPFNPPASFQKTDIVKWWELETYFTYTNTSSTQASLVSPYAPFNLIQNFKLKLQGQYSPLEVESGIDLWFWQLMRPMRGKGQQSSNTLAGQYPVGIQTGTSATTLASLYTYPVLGLNPNPPLTVNGSSTGTYAMFSPSIASKGMVYQTAANTPTQSGVVVAFNLELPAGIWLDQYWDLAVDGSLLPNASGVVQPVSAFVSPQYMGGGERVIVPQFNFAPITATNVDQGPITLGLGGTNGTTSGSAVINARRIGVYSSENPAELPPVYNWQYRRASKRYPIGAVTKVDIPITEYGQLFSVFVRLFDPTSATGVPVDIYGSTSGVPNSSVTATGTQITKCQLLYGSNLPKFDDSVFTMQNRFIQQHGFPPLNGTVVWDLLASGQDDLLTNNSRVLNTLTNANCHVHLEFNSAPGASTYAVIGTELLVPVSTQ
jgi:hypothetical protein